jgi:hypothetical protein
LFSVGTGGKGKNFNFDVADQSGHGPPHTVTGSTSSSPPGLTSGQTADGKHDFISHAMPMSVGWHF